MSGQDFIAALATASGGNLQIIIAQLQNVTTALNALNTALTVALANPVNPSA